MIRRLTLLSLGWLLLFAKAARCEEPEFLKQDEPKPPPAEPEPFMASQHFEIGMGFLGGERDLGRNGFAFGAPAQQRVLAPLTTDPYNALPVAGASWELRMVVSDLRMAVGVEKPFAAVSFDPVNFSDATDGGMHTLTPRSLNLWDVRFGLGFEHRFSHVAPFVDLLGDIQSISTNLNVDGANKSYQEWTWAFAVRAGVRFQLPHYMFIAPSAELGVYGPARWAVTLQTGWQIPMNFD